MNQTDLQEILRRAGVEVCGSTPRGWLACRCPFAPYLHGKGRDGRPSFFAHANSTGTSGANCFTCGTKGSIPSVLRRLGHHRGDVAEMRALAMEADLLDLEQDFGDFEDGGRREAPPAPLNPHIYANLYGVAWDDRRARAYLQRRGVTKDAADLLGLLYDPEDWRVLFPAKDGRGELHGFSGRSVIDGPPPYEGYPKVRDYAGLKKAHRLLGEHLFRQGGGLPPFVVEGLMALAHLVSVGARDVCEPCATMGAHMSDQQAATLLSYDRPVYLCYDDDEAGDVGTYGANGDPGATGRLAPHLPTMVALYPPHRNDPDLLTLADVRRIITTDHEIA